MGVLGSGSWPFPSLRECRKIKTRQQTGIKHWERKVELKDVKKLHKAQEFSYSTAEAGIGGCIPNTELLNLKLFKIEAVEFPQIKSPI